MSVNGDDDQTGNGRTIACVKVNVADVVVEPNRGEVDTEAMAALGESMSTIGLKTPITIRWRTREIGPEWKHTEPVLVAGLHRLEAARSLGWPEIDCLVFDGDENEARMWEIAENLHRRVRNQIQRSAYIAEWVERAIAKSGQYVQKAGSGRPQGGTAAAARVLPVPGETAEARRKTIERSLKVNSISPEAKEAASAAGLADNQQALLDIAKEVTKEAQMEMVAKLATHKRAKSEPATRKKAKPKPKPKPATPAVVAPAAFRTTQGEAADLQKHLAGIGHRIEPDDLIVAPGSKSMDARPSEFAIIRIPDSHPNRETLIEAIISLSKNYNTEVFIKNLPEAATATEPGDNGADKGGRDE